MTDKLIFNKPNNVKPVALVAPLDWGLGHATRCIPIIKECLNAGFEVIIASEGRQKVLLQFEFPALNFVNLTGYRIKYASGRWLTIFQIVFQIPKILIAINKEKKWLSNFVNHKHLDLIISDNRFGLHKPGIVSVFVTHQLYIKTPFGNLLNQLLQKINYHFINQFNYCWVPDTENENNIGGQLSHPLIKPECNLRYIGILSRIKREAVPITNKLLILLSGPEPQRSIFEEDLLSQLMELSVPAVFVRGLPGSSDTINPVSALTIFNHIAGEQLQHLINQSEIVISRSGYTTIMEVLPLGKKCIFIPTPGQPEQEYLATYLADKGWACIASQNNFSLHDLIKRTEKLQIPELSSLLESTKLMEAVSELIQTGK